MLSIITFQTAFVLTVFLSNREEQGLWEHIWIKIRNSSSYSRQLKARDRGRKCRWRTVCSTFSLFSHGFVHVCSVVFTWFYPCFQCKNSSGYPHFPYRDNDMIFRILDLLSNGQAAVVNGRAFEFDPVRIVITSEHFTDNCLHASCSILCGIHSADETQSGRNSCPDFALN